MDDLGNVRTPPTRSGAGSNPATRAGGARRLTVLSPEERHALYALPDFDDFQRAEYFAFTPAERAAAEQRRGCAARIVFMLQLGYFKAKQAFFDLSADAISADDVTWLSVTCICKSSTTTASISSKRSWVQ